MADEKKPPLTITIGDKVYVVPRYSRAEYLLYQVLQAIKEGGGGVLPPGYTFATDEDIDNLFP